MPLIAARYPGKCRACGIQHGSGVTVFWIRGERGVLCEGCFATGGRAADRSTAIFSSHRSTPFPVASRRAGWLHSDVLGVASVCVLCGAPLAANEEVLVNAAREPVCMDSCQAVLPKLDIETATVPQIEARIAELDRRYMLARYG